ALTEPVARGDQLGIEHAEHAQAEAELERYYQHGHHGGQVDPEQGAHRANFEHACDLAIDRAHRREPGHDVDQNRQRPKDDAHDYLRDAAQAEDHQQDRIEHDLRDTV